MTSTFDLTPKGICGYGKDFETFPAEKQVEAGKVLHEALAILKGMSSSPEGVNPSARALVEGLTVEKIEKTLGALSDAAIKSNAIRKRVGTLLNKYVLREKDKPSSLPKGSWYLQRRQGEGGYRLVKGEEQKNLSWDDCYRLAKGTPVETVLGVETKKCVAKPERFISSSTAWKAAALATVVLGGAGAVAMRWASSSGDSPTVVAAANSSSLQTTVQPQMAPLAETHSWVQVGVLPGESPLLREPDLSKVFGQATTFIRYERGHSANFTDQHISLVHPQRYDALPPRQQAADAKSFLVYANDILTHETDASEGSLRLLIDEASRRGRALEKTAEGGPLASELHAMQQKGATVLIEACIQDASLPEMADPSSRLWGVQSSNTSISHDLPGADVLSAFDTAKETLDKAQLFLERSEPILDPAFKNTTEETIQQRRKELGAWKAESLRSIQTRLETELEGLKKPFENPAELRSSVVEFFSDIRENAKFLGKDARSALIREGQKILLTSWKEEISSLQERFDTQEKNAQHLEKLSTEIQSLSDGIHESARFLSKTYRTTELSDLTHSMEQLQQSIHDQITTAAADNYVKESTALFSEQARELVDDQTPVGENPFLERQNEALGTQTKESVIAAGFEQHLDIQNGLATALHGISQLNTTSPAMAYQNLEEALDTAAKRVSDLRPANPPLQAEFEKNIEDARLALASRASVHVSSDKMSFSHKEQVINWFDSFVKKVDWSKESLQKVRTLATPHEGWMNFLGRTMKNILFSKSGE